MASLASCQTLPTHPSIESRPDFDSSFLDAHLSKEAAPGVYGWVLEDGTYGPIQWHNGVWFSYYTEVRVFPKTGLIAIGFTNRQQDEQFDVAFRRAVRIANDEIIREVSAHR